MLKPISPEETYDLRHRILRPTQQRSDCAYPLDHEPDTYHAGFFADGKLVGVGTVFREPMEHQADADTWRIRGMAVDTDHQGSGIGGQLLASLIEHAARHSVPGLIWCNGRANVQAFYERFGFEQVGDLFDLPPLGPHVVLKRALTLADR